ncbi:hypothetical protein BD779DRAFT_243524 [Infundibulicybe gibba]|nr:hypothetical protein BD779DRAFT_243524 [Infundibulicybe gibba]
MAPTFAELKQKAGKVKDASVSKIQNTKDRHTSVPMAKTNWDPYSKQPPPPPPPPRGSATPRAQFPPPPPAPNRPSPAVTPPLPGRGNPPPTLPGRYLSGNPPTLPGRSPATPATAESRAPTSAPPPIVRRTRPDVPARNAQPGNDIDWANLSEEDKQAFFSWLDEFFSKMLNTTVKPSPA